MDTKELDEDLDYFRDRIIQLANGSKLSEQMKKSLSGVAGGLEAARDDQVPDNIKATVLSLGKLVVRAALLPDWTIDEFDSNLMGSILQHGTPLQ